ncbi:hypothetical protein QS257_09360 [Terrilactibacillus sp. S3-3]|nr:hypothetical protein QS257_09360 [Terrilactibacillus sp. S3-3]
MIQHSGSYIVGKQFPPGSYILSCHDKEKNDKQDEPLVQILPSFNKNSLSSLSVKPGQPISLDVEKGHILQIDKTILDESDSLTMFLQKDR